MSEPNVFDFLAYLKALTPEDRAIHFQLAEQRYCWHCGGPQGECECGWPKVEDWQEEPCPVCGTPALLVVRATTGVEACSPCHRAAASLASPNRKEEP